MPLTAPEIKKATVPVVLLINVVPPLLTASPPLMVSGAYWLLKVT